MGQDGVLAHSTVGKARIQARIRSTTINPKLGLRGRNGPLKLAVSIYPEFVMCNVYTNATSFGRTVEHPEESTKLAC
jgi:hypothetical protein